jgi:hypothetical protein
VFEMIRDHLSEQGHARPDLAAVAFMRAFTGVVLKIPSTEHVEKIARDVQIVTSLTARPHTSTRCIANLQGTSTRQIAKTLSRKSGQGLQRIRSNAKSRRSRFLGATRRRA